MVASFDGKHVLVAGLGVVGRACVEWFLAEGATVALLDAGVSLVRSEIAAGSDRLIPMDVELDDWTAIGECGSRWLDERGRLDVLVNAQMAIDGSGIEDAEIESVERVVSINLIGPLVCTKAFLPALKRSGEGAIVHIGSIDGVYGNGKVASYSISKGGLNPLTHVMAAELAKYGIRVNEVARAGVVPVQSADRPQGGSPVDMNKLVEATPLRRLAHPEELANVVGFLASGEASYVTGSTVTVDGGRTAVTPGLA